MFHLNSNQWDGDVKIIAPRYKLKIQHPSPHARQADIKFEGCTSPIWEAPHSFHIYFVGTHCLLLRRGGPTLHIAMTPIKVIRRIFLMKGRHRRRLLPRALSEHDETNVSSSSIDPRIRLYWPAHSSYSSTEPSKACTTNYYPCNVAVVDQSTMFLYL